MDRILRECQQQAEQERAGWRFCLLGQGGLRVGTPVHADEWPDARLAAAARLELGGNVAGKALPILVERITLRCYQNTGNLEAAEPYLRAALGITAGDERLPRCSGLSIAIMPACRAWPESGSCPYSGHDN